MHVVCCSAAVLRSSCGTTFNGMYKGCTHTCKAWQWRMACSVCLTSPCGHRQHICKFSWTRHPFGAAVVTCVNPDSVTTCVRKQGRATNAVHGLEPSMCYAFCGAVQHTLVMVIWSCLWCCVQRLHPVCVTCVAHLKVTLYTQHLTSCQDHFLWVNPHERSCTAQLRSSEAQVWQQSVCGRSQVWLCDPARLFAC
jgi:hypothetical protein